MAGDWIKMQTDLYRDPKVIIMAEYLCSQDITLRNVTPRVTRQLVVGVLVSVWGVARKQGKREGDDLVLYGTPMSVIDAIAQVENFSDAMASVGWIMEENSDLRFPRFFDEHNVDPRSIEQRKNAERQRRFREKGGGNKDKWIATRKRILKRDGSVCGYCGENASTVDHIIPTSKDGSGEDQNLVACCTSCNQKKNNRTPEQAGMKVTLHNSLRNADVTHREEESREEKSTKKTGTGTAGVLSLVTQEILADPKRVLDWFRKASTGKQKILKPTETIKRCIVHLAQRVLRDTTVEDPVKVFVANVRDKNFKMTNAEEDRAIETIKMLERGPPQERDSNLSSQKKTAGGELAKLKAHFGKQN